MRTLLIVPVLSLLAAPSLAQEVVKIPAKEAPTVSRPDDLFNLPPGQWHYAKQLWSGNAPCDIQHCEAGYTDGILAVSVERSEKFVRLIAGFRNCEAVGFSEMEPGNKPGKYNRKKVRKQVNNVVKGVAKSCNLTAPTLPDLDPALLYPAKVG
ncbi:hypothetical protein LZ496_02045 [Sphingomonas sp. NSE70-1]|uniref:Beta/Gamma crystallin n=1 Tax=Sphingomonas caseinilyticus TaxID=2908205 RepID=A0ABT0RRD4_9SPHN|nr:hypothetical protein [Sphingomonas caseinilyticus]MCL6697567.1 hypothetical protein [Sphingomonas caseinilyticus]